MGGSWLNVSHQPGGREFKRDLLRGLPRRYFMHVPPIVMTGLLIILHMIYTKYMYVLGCTTLEWWGKPPAKQEGGSRRSAAAIGNGVRVMAISLEEGNNIRTRCRG